MNSPLLTNYYRGGLKQGYSLRASLESQGVTCMTAMRLHLNRALTLLQLGIMHSIIEYRVDDNHPNSGKPATA